MAITVLSLRGLTVEINEKRRRDWGEENGEWQEAWIHLPPPPGGGPERRIGPFAVSDFFYSEDAEASLRVLLAWLADLGIVE